jgi:hypothetical protein
VRGALVLMTLVALAAPAGADGSVLGRPGRFTCGGSVSFPQSAFRNPTGAEAGADPASQALRDYVTHNPGRHLPTGGWRELVRTADQAVFQNGPPSSRVGLTVRLVDGTWSVVGSGCSARRVVPGLSATQVGLRRRPSARGRALSVVLSGGACVENPGRLKRLEVHETRHTVTLLALLRPDPPLPPDTACPAIGIVRFVPVRLNRPVGGRVIRDASRFPARVLGRGR